MLNREIISCRPLLLGLTGQDGGARKYRPDFNDRATCEPPIFLENHMETKGVPWADI